ncbi:MAG TPA: hypothetical protein VGE90_18755 [Chitinophaga sp.]
MKKSTRLVWTLIFTVVLLTVAVNLFLYRQLLLGNVVTLKQVQATRLLRFDLSGINNVVLNGTVWVNIIPADSDVIEIPKEEFGARMDQRSMLLNAMEIRGGKTPVLRQEGDTLYVQGSVRQPLHRPYADWFYRQSVGQINLYTSALRSIRIVNGQILINGGPAPVSGKSFSLDAVNATVWLAERDGQDTRDVKRDELPDEFFDSVNIRCVNTVMLLNRYAVVRNLSARLDSASELIDRDARIGQPCINSSADSRVSLTGKNLIKTTIEIH